jgi:hypothetical protein
MVDDFATKSGEVVVGDVLELDDALLESKWPLGLIELVADASPRTGDRNARTVDLVPSVAVVSPESGASLKLTELRLRLCANNVPFLPSGCFAICAEVFDGDHVEFCGVVGFEPFGIA